MFRRRVGAGAVVQAASGSVAPDLGSAAPSNPEKMVEITG
jgi:hypothetical protein